MSRELSPPPPDLVYALAEEGADDETPDRGAPVWAAARVLADEEECRSEWDAMKAELQASPPAVEQPEMGDNREDHRPDRCRRGMTDGDAWLATAFLPRK